MRPTGPTGSRVRGDRSGIVLAWLATRLLVLVAAVAGTVSATSGTGLSPGSYLRGWNQWDTQWFVSIADYGYVGPYVDGMRDFHYNVAFFPAFPLLLDAGQTAGLDPVLTGMAISAAASLVAAFGLARLVEDAGGRGAVGALAWLAAPTALFLAAAYTEALFAAFAVWSWFHAKRGRWLLAGVLAGGAALTRPNGLFLAVGLIVLVATQGRGRRRWRDAWPIAIPLLATVGYFAYLHALTGSWTAWSDAQRDYWRRELVAPWTALRNTYELIFTFSPTGEPSSRMVTEIIAMAILVATVALLVKRRWWGEAAYAGITALSLGTSTMYHSVPRTLAIVFPLWVLLGGWLSRHRRALVGYLVVCLPFLALVTMRFVQGQWIS